MNIHKEIRLRIQSAINPIFMPRNEEEVMKNILILNRELRFVNDIPEVMISFLQQTNKNIAFTVLVVRILKSQTVPFEKILSEFSPAFKIQDVEKRLLGMVRKKYVKEGLIFTIEVDKKPFLRRDYSIDFYQARGAVFRELERVFGSFRDFNGGMISKQSEALHELKRQLLTVNIQNDFIIDQFYYSLTPKYLRTIIPTNILKKASMLVFEALEYNFDRKKYFFKTQNVSGYLLVTIGAVNPSMKEYIDQVIDEHMVESFQVMVSHITVIDITCLTFILHPSHQDSFEKILHQIMYQIKIWAKVIGQVR